MASFFWTETPYHALYGCWCYFDTPDSGHGEPVDEIDAQCKALKGAYSKF